MKKNPPPKKAGGSTGPRRFDGEVLDVTGAASVFGTKEKVIRARVARRSIPHHRWGGRIVFLKTELFEFLAKLEGVGVDEALANVRQAGERA